MINSELLKDILKSVVDRYIKHYKNHTVINLSFIENLELFKDFIESYVDGIYFVINEQREEFKSKLVVYGKKNLHD